jgi:hypothetical protein
MVVTLGLSRQEGELAAEDCRRLPTAVLRSGSHVLVQLATVGCHELPPDALVSGGGLLSSWLLRAAVGCRQLPPGAPVIGTLLQL